MTHPLFYIGLVAIGVGAFVMIRKRRKRSRLDTLKDNVKTNLNHVSEEVGKKVHELRSQAQQAQSA